MKKHLIILLIFISVSGAYAQQFKMFGGSIISNYTEKWPTHYIIQDASFFRSPFQNSKTGFTVGIGIEFALNKIIAIEVDAQYFQRGSFFEYYYIFAPWNMEITEGEVTIKETYNMKGIGFPILVKAKFLPRPFPYIIGGCELSFILSHSRTIWHNDYIYERKEDILEYTGGDDFTLIFGCGFEMKISKLIFFLEGRYNLGQNNLYTGSWYYPYRPKIKATALQIIAGFKI